MEHEVRVMDDELRDMLNRQHKKRVLKEECEKDHFEQEEDLFEV